MTKIYPLGLLLIAAVVPVSAQTSACAGRTNLLCAIPNLYGPSGLVLPNPGISPQFLSAFQTNFASTASGLTQLPLASSASGFVYQYDHSTGLYTRTTESLGPVLTERGETIGRHKFYFGGNFQRFRFSKLDGVDLHNLPAVVQAAPGTANSGDPLLAAQFISTRNSVDIKINQYTAFGTFGLTNRVDVSVAVPFSQIGFNVNSVATINRILGTEPILLPNASNPASPTVTCCSNGGPGPYGPVFGNFFDAQNPQTSTIKEFSNAQSKTSAAGVGDILLRVKGNVYHDDKLNLALLADVRLPTGDASNFLGSGAFGVRPLAALSVRTGPLTPHINAGFWWNGDSVLGGNPYTGTKGKLPNIGTFAAGTDIGVTKFITLSVDYLGQELIDAPRISTTTFSSPGPLAATGQVGTFTTIVPINKQTYNQSDAAFGVKFATYNRLLFTGNVIVALNDGGLRQKVTPLIGISYVF